MPITQEQKNLIKFYRQLQSNPDLAMFQFAQSLKKEIEEKMKEVKSDAIELLRKEMISQVANIEKKDPTNSGFIEKIVNKTVTQLVKDTKGDKGDIGGIGPDGHTPTEAELKTLIEPIVIAFKDLFKGDKGDLGDTIKGDKGDTGKDGTSIEGPSGKIPVLGKDYLTPLDLQKIIEKIQIPLLGKVQLKINEFEAIIKKWENAQRFGGKTLHRGGGGDNEPLVGTKDGANKVFTVVRTPKFITFNGQSIYLGSGYSGAGKVITLDVAPNSGEIVRSHF